MKKFFALIIAFFMLFAFVGCDNSTEFDFELRFNKIFEDVDVDNVTSDLKLPTSIGSLTIVWESSNTDVLSNDGKIFNTTGEVISVTLTAHMQHEKEKADLSKDLKIAPTGGIKDILEGETGTYKIKGTVVAINARSFIISDGTNGILVFKGGSWACDVEIGEVLELRGETTKYPTSLTEGVGVQFGQDAVYKRVSTGTYTYPAAKELKAADVENYAKEKIIKPEYVKLTGKLSVSDNGDGKVYYNLVIDGTKIKGSLAYPTNSEELKALDGKNVEVYGYIVYGTGSTSVNFLNIVSTEVKEVGGGSVVEPDPETKKISDILAAEDGSYTAEGTVIATYARGFLIDDTTGKILVFLGQEFDGSIKVGDTVKVQGSTSLYGLMKQFGLDTTVEKTGEGKVTQPTATEIDGAKLDEFADLKEAQVQYVKMTGKLTVSGNYFNLEVSGASKVTGSITYPQDQEALNALAGKNIEVTGYFIGVTGSSKKYANIMVTEFKEVGGSVVEPEPEVKTIAEILAADLGEYTTEGTVVAVNAKGILIQDETGYIYAFIGQEPAVKVGDTVKVKGTTSEFALAKQFGSGIEVTKTGEGTVTHPVAKELDGAKLDEYANATEAKVEYITFTGTLAADRYYNVTVEGASNVIGSITYPLNADEIKALNGKTVTVTGYLTGIASSNKYANVIAVEVKEVGGSVVEPEPEPITGDVVLDFVKNFGTYANSWKNNYSKLTVTGKDLGLENNISVVLSNASKQTGTITDRPVMASKDGNTEYVTITGFAGSLNNVIIELMPWGGTAAASKKFASIVMEYSEDGTTWTKASDDVITGDPAVIIEGTQVKSNVSLASAKYVRLAITGSGSKNMQLGLTSISLNFKK